MLHLTDTTVFNVEAEVIVNTVNCVGVMGNGLALECKLRFPEMYEDYVVRCRRGEVRIGKPYLYRDPNDSAILNFPAKDHWKYPSQLEWIRLGLAGMVPLIKDCASVAVPPLGCDLGKLQWDDVRPLIEEYLGVLPIDIYLCVDREEQATGVEGEMVRLLNEMGEQGQLPALHLPTSSVKALLGTLPIKRFREVRAIGGLGKVTYAQLHRLLFRQVTGQPPERRPGIIGIGSGILPIFVG
ncbi:MAG: macro domain-containing protein [Armatimonadota bacterium]